MGLRSHGAVFALGCTLAIAGVSAQQTWIVDPNGTGNFLEPGAAIAAASPGDTLLLRGGGDYQGSYTLSKVLAILGTGPQRSRVRSLIVGPGLVGNGTVSLAGFDIAFARIRAPASLEDVAMSTCWIESTTASLHRCSYGGEFDFYGVPNSGDVGYMHDSDVVLTECVLRGGRGFWIQTLVCHYWAGAPPVGCHNSDVLIADCTLHGSNSAYIWCGPGATPPGPAVAVGAGRVRVTRSTLVGGMDFAAVRTAAVVQGPFSVFEYDASTQFTPANTLGSVTFLPATGGQGAPPGGTMTCRALCGPNLPAVLVAGLGLRGPTATPLGLAWVDPAAYVVLVIGFTDPSGVLNATIPIPSWGPRGLPITVQSAVVPGATGDLVAGVPVVLHVL